MNCVLLHIHVISSFFICGCGCERYEKLQLRMQIRMSKIAYVSQMWILAPSLSYTDSQFCSFDYDSMWYQHLKRLGSSLNFYVSLKPLEIRIRRPWVGNKWGYNACSLSHILMLLQVKDIIYILGTNCIKSSTAPQTKLREPVPPDDSHLLMRETMRQYDCAE